MKAKGAATRHLAPYALHLMQTFSDGSEVDRMALKVCEFIVEFYTHLRVEDRILSEDAKARIGPLGRSLAIIYQTLSARALATNHRIWKMAPKVHLFVHLCEWQGPEWGTPRRGGVTLTKIWLGR